MDLISLIIIMSEFDFKIRTNVPNNIHYKVFRHTGGFVMNIVKEQCDRQIFATTRESICNQLKSL